MAESAEADHRADPLETMAALVAQLEAEAQAWADDAMPYPDGLLAMYRHALAAYRPGASGGLPQPQDAPGPPRCPQGPEKPPRGAEERRGRGAAPGGCCVCAPR